MKSKLFLLQINSELDDTNIHISHATPHEIISIMGFKYYKMANKHVLMKSQRFRTCCSDHMTQQAKDKTILVETDKQKHLMITEKDLTILTMRGSK